MTALINPKSSTHVEAVQCHRVMVTDDYIIVVKMDYNKAYYPIKGYTLVGTTY